MEREENHSKTLQVQIPDIPAWEEEKKNLGKKS